MADEKNEPITVVYQVGSLVVREWYRYACGACRTGWEDGKIVSPRDGGPVCTHGKGSWQVGKIGPRGGWQSWSQSYPSKQAAILVADALVQAANLPAQGVS